MKASDQIERDLSRVGRNVRFAVWRDWWLEDGKDYRLVIALIMIVDLILCAAFSFLMYAANLTLPVRLGLALLINAVVLAIGFTLSVFIWQENRQSP